MDKLGRREFLRRGGRFGLGLGVGAALGAAGLPASPARVEAGEEMCAGDPIISIDGTTVSITCHIPVSALNYLSQTHPVRYTVYLPKGVKAAKQVQYTGPIPEALNFVTTDVRLDQGVFPSAYILIRIDVPAPPAGVTPYAVAYSAASAYDSASGRTVAGRPASMIVRIPWKG